MDIPPDMWLAFIRPLNRLGVEYMVTGSAASMAYGEPRLTLDVDIVLQLVGGRVRDFVQAFPVEDYYCPPEDVIVRKLEYFREGRSEKHLRDIAGMLRVTGEAIDRQAIEEWTQRMGLAEEWTLARATA